ncbi:hypothetical protein ACA910_017483 [Epithemia clementina (nom. ined.)]
MEASVVKYEEDLEVMIEELQEIRSLSKINCEENPRVAQSTGSKNNTSSIHFSLERRTCRILVEYNNRINRNLELRGMDSTTGSLKERQECLQGHMILEWAYERTKSSIDISKERQAKALFLLLNTVPCILHAENRMGIKMLTMLLIEGLSNYVRCLHLGDKAAAEKFLQKLEEIVNAQIFGDERQEAQWICPVFKEKNEIGQITMSNIRTRKIMKNVDLLLELCVSDATRMDKWRQCNCIDYHDMLQLLTSHTNLTTKEINKFQLHADFF